MTKRMRVKYVNIDKIWLKLISNIILDKWESGVVNGTIEQAKNISDIIQILFFGKSVFGRNEYLSICILTNTKTIDDRIPIDEVSFASIEKTIKFLIDNYSKPGE